MTDCFRYRDGVLCAENVPLDAIARAVGTPAYVYSAAHMRGQLNRFFEAFAGQRIMVCYALKANSNLAVIKTLADCGAGAEIVSGGELERALAVGVPPERIVFAGVAKSRTEMAQALDADIAQFNVESVPELEALSAVAAHRGQRAPIAVRINPDVIAGGHDKISTGRKQDKFGIGYDDALDTYRLAQRLEGIEVVGLHMHIGSQIVNLAPYRTAYRRAIELAHKLRDEGIRLRRIDLGGGVGVGSQGEPGLDLAGYAALVRDLGHGPDLELVFEPGRYLVADAGVLLSRVLYIKEGALRPCVILDAGMNDLLRPALYEAYHPIMPVGAPDPGASPQKVDVVGPICESADVFAREREMAPLRADDLVAFGSAGAYGAVMASDYNSRPLAAEVLVDGDRFAAIRPRLEAAVRFANEKLPPWMAATDLSRSARD